jgi:hypothetical protein
MTQPPPGVTKPSWLTDHPRLIMAGLFLVAMVPLMATPVLPLIDFYDHIARFFVLAHLSSDSILRLYYQAHWVLQPDIGTDLIGTPLLRVLPALMAAHLVAVGILAILYGGVLYFNRALTGRASLLAALLLLPLLYSYVFNWGFANFLLSLGFAFWAAGWWVSQRHRPWLAMPVACMASVIVFLSHGLAFALYGMIVASLEVGFFLNAPVRRPLALLRALGLLLLQAVIPLSLFLLWYVQHDPGPPITFSTMMPHPGDGAPPFHGYHRFSTIFRVEEGPFLWFDILTFLLQLGLGAVLVWRKDLNVARPAWLLLAVGSAFIVITPTAMFGVYYIVDRMPLFVALCLLGALSFHPRADNRTRRIPTRAIVAMLAVIVFARLAVVAWDWRSYDAQHREFQAIAAQIPPGSLAMEVMVGSGHHETGVPRCEMYGPLMIALHGQVGPLFAISGQHPLLLKDPLKTAVETLERRAPVPGERARDYNPYIRAAAASGFDYLLVCNAHLLRHRFPDNVTVMEKTSHFALLKVVK